jgi:hypothetical protein
MFVLIFIIGLIIILWPVIGGAVSAIFSFLATIASLPFYWSIRIVKSPKDEAEDVRITKVSSAIGLTILGLGLVILIALKA